jgi:hypothetical protein
VKWPAPSPVSRLTSSAEECGGTHDLHITVAPDFFKVLQIVCDDQCLGAPRGYGDQDVADDPVFLRVRKRAMSGRWRAVGLPPGGTR